MEKILVFGHKNPDTDAICSSLVMADLQTKIRGEEVISCRLGNLNEETKYALNYFKVEEPKLIEKVDEGQRVILVDHNEFTQSVEGIEKAKIEAVVDHHRINNFKTSEPLFYYAQPVGCTSTILFELYHTNNIEIEPKIAGLMLSAIISAISANILYFILHIQNGSSFPKPLSAKEEYAQLEKMAQGDKNARAVLIERNLRLVSHIVKKYYSKTNDTDDLISIGTIGLIKAIDSFDYTKGTRLATYASRCIENEILMYLRKNKKRKADVSLDESLSFDSEGNELHLEDILGTEKDIVTKDLEENDMRKIMLKEIGKLNERDKQDYHSIYIELYNEFRNKAKQEKTDVTEDVVFEMELIKSIEVNIDYILGLVKKYHDSNMKDKEILVSIQKAIMASPDLRNKKDLIMAFIDSLDQDSNVYADFESFMNSKKKEELDKIITEENLNKEETYNFIQKSFEQGRVETNGTEVSTILPPMSMFTPTNDRQEKKNKVIDKLLEFFDKFFSITGKYGE